jgi:hypothetical protein
MAVLIRIPVVIFAYLLACVAASSVLAIGTLAPEWNDVLSLGVQAGTIWPVIALGAAVIAAVSLLPAMLVIVVAEGFAMRSIVFYAALGAVLALFLFFGLNLFGYVAEPDGGDFLAREREVLAAAGIAAGLTYWLVAGRKAGLWQSRR